ncbi:MAG: Tim44/TimA family putative adaptor protein [Alphaproteobacteria bacterium]|jgi:predicted lipid-binding transport protein (Tim44 family)|nr:Tim44/TimA family putative adaptor protein [Alphaproteobacteria bacterium]
MGDDFELLRILIFAAIAAFLVLRLRSVLGRRTGEEQERRSPFSGSRSSSEHNSERETADQHHDNVVTMPDRTRRESGQESAEEEGSQSLAAGLTQIRVADPGFDAGQFVHGARRAFAMIVEAYAKGDTGTLRPLLSDDLYDAFSTAIRERLNQGESLETRVLRMKSADILEARMEGRTALVTVKFVTDQTNVTRGRDGEIVEGDPDEPSEVVDIWTFARNTRASDPNWLLVETRTPN